MWIHPDVRYGSVGSNSQRGRCVRHLHFIINVESHPPATIPLLHLKYDLTKQRKRWAAGNLRSNIYNTIAVHLYEIRSQSGGSQQLHHITTKMADIFSLSRL